jgi:hypothetical protein
VQLAPPADIPADKRALWHREFDRFPPGYYTPADIRAMLLYLDICQRYDLVTAITDASLRTGQLPSKRELSSLTSVTRERIRMQSALRMFPASRASKDLFANLANNPGAQASVPGHTDDWRGMMTQVNGKLRAVPTTAPKRKAKGAKP